MDTLPYVVGMDVGINFMSFKKQRKFNLGIRLIGGKMTWEWEIIFVLMFNKSVFGKSFMPCGKKRGRIKRNINCVFCDQFDPNKNIRYVYLSRMREFKNLRMGK